MSVTLDQYAPFDSGAGSNVTEDGWRAMMRRLCRSGVIRDVANSTQVYADSTGMQVKVKTGEMWAEGHWGLISTEKIVTIAAAHATLARLDLIVWRIDYVNNRIEVDAVTGTAGATPVAPNLTRNSSIHECPLAIVSVPAADTGIDAAQVIDARMWGGPPTGTLADDYDLYGDKVSSLLRTQVATLDVSANGTTLACVFRCLRDCTVTKTRFYLGTAQSGGAVAFKIYTGYHRGALLDVTGASTLPINVTVSPNALHEDNTPSSISLIAGQYVALAQLTTSSSTAPTYGCSIGLPPELINPGASSNWGVIFKTGQTVLPSSINVGDGSWSRRDRAPWFALA